MRKYRDLNSARLFRRRLHSLLRSPDGESQTGTFDILDAMISMSHSTLSVLLLGPCESCETQAVEAIQTSLQGERSNAESISDVRPENQQIKSVPMRADAIIVGAKEFFSWESIDLRGARPLLVVLCKEGTSSLQREIWLTGAYEVGYRLSRDGHRFVGVRTDRGRQSSKT